MKNISLKQIHWLVYASLISLSIGLFTSITFSALQHIFILLPIFYFIPKINFKVWKKSQWMLLVLILIMILSILFNQDIAVKHYQPLSKIKYYIIGLFSIFPINSWYESLNDDEKNKKIKILIHALFITSIIASLYGMGRVFWGINPLHLSYSDATRNTGFFGMVLNFAHNLAFLQLFTTVLLIYREETKKFVSTKFLILVWAINFFSLYTTYSRGALLAFILAVPLIFIFKNLKNFLIIIVIIGFSLFSVRYFPSLNIVRAGSDAERVSQWQTAVVAFKERPILGMGYLNFEKMCPSLKVKYDIGQKQFCGHAHNIYLENLASSGFLGFLFLVLWQIFWIYEMFARKDLLGKMMISLIGVFIIGGMTQATFTLGANLFLIMGLYSISFVKTHGNSNDSSNL
jgi:O-antigen ligase